MPVYKRTSNKTKDGRCYFFKVNYRDSFNRIKSYSSKLYSTKQEAKDEERLFLNKLDEKNRAPVKMTLGDLWNRFLEYQEDKVKINTKRGYLYKEKYLKSMFSIKCNDFNIQHYEAWKKDMNKIESMKDVSKNDVLKVFVTVLHWGMAHYNFNFAQTIMLMTKFKNPDEVPVDREIYSVEEFNQFLSAEDELKYRCLWQTLYYNGLRIGEARGLQWKDVDWDNKTISINKQVQDIDNYSATYYVCSLKTQSSKRTLPICDNLYSDLLEYYNSVKVFKNFSEEFWIFGEDYGIRALTYQCARRRKGSIAKKAEVKEIRLHDFRHSCASLLINKGLPVTVVSKYMGHASINETLHTYAHIFNGALNDVSDVLNELEI